MRLTQNQFAAEIGRHPMTVSSWERGATEPDNDDLDMLAQFISRRLSVTLDSATLKYGDLLSRLRHPDQAREEGERDRLKSYALQTDAIAQTLRTIPHGIAFREIKVALLNATESAALGAGLTLPVDYYKLRRQVLEGAA